MDVEEALRDVRFMKALAVQTRGGMFRQGAPFFLIWGIVWLVGYLMPVLGVPGSLQGPFWLVLDGLGALVSVWVGSRRAREHGPAPFLVRKWMWSGFIVLGLLAAAVALALPGHDLFSGTAFFLVPVSIGAWYALGGIFSESPLFLLLGLWIALVSVASPFLPLAYAWQLAVVALLGATAMIVASIVGLRS